MSTDPHNPNPTRRTFVKTTLAGVGGAMLLASTASGETPTTAKSDEPITMGVIGIGKQASGHLEYFSGLKNVRVLAVCDVDTVRREAARDTVNKKNELLERKDAKCDEYKDFHELLARKDIQAVLIGVPDHWHAAIVIEACKAGKDIYCEKPLTLTIFEAKTLIDAVRKHDRVFQTGSQQRSEGPFRQACDYIRNGRLGKITEVLVGVGATSKPCDLPGEDPDPGVLWDVWLGQAPQRPYNHVLCQKGLPNSYPFNPGWRDYREFSGGYVTDWGAHHFDIVQWALSMDHSGPDEVLPPANPEDKYGAKVIYRGSPAGDPITVTHVNKVYETRGKPKSPADTDPKPEMQTNGILFIGEKGKIFVSRSMIVSEPESILKEPLGADDKKLPVSPGHRPNWLECIVSRERPICDVEIGARSVTVCHLVNLAYWHGRKLSWDPAKWEFPGDDEANGWRTRPRRPGYELPEI